MLDHKTVAFRMPSNLPAVSASFLDSDTFAAVDGSSCDVYLFSQNGECLQTIPTARAYRTIRFERTAPSCTVFYALGNCNTGTPRRVYVLNCRFDEIGSFDLRTDPCTDCADTCVLADIAPANGMIEAAYRHSVRRHSTDGMQVDIVLHTDRNRLIQNYAVSGTARALAYRKNGTQFISVFEIGAEYLGTHDDALILRDLVSYGLGDFYGLFGYRYLYNYLVPIYRNGAFCMQTENTAASVLQSLLTCE